MNPRLVILQAWYRYREWTHLMKIRLNEIILFKIEFHVGKVLQTYNFVISMGKVIRSSFSGSIKTSIERPCVHLIQIYSPNLVAGIIHLELIHTPLPS